MSDRRGDGSTRRVDRRRRLAAVGRIALPALALLAVWWAEPASPAGRFRAALAGMVVITALGAFGARASGVPVLRGVVPRLVSAAALAALAYGLLSADPSGALSLFVLYLGVGAAASGLAALGRAMRTPSAVAGTVAACVLWTAMAGLFWADPVAEHIDRTRRRPLRQAVLHVDPALALAYGAVGYDRLRSDPIYFEVPLASSLYERPAALTTGGVWFLAGLAAWVVVLVLETRARRSASEVATEGAIEGVPAP